MKVIVSCGAKFHSFHLAEQLYKRRHLHRLITSYYDPKRNAKEYNIDKSRISTSITSALLWYSLNKIRFLKRWDKLPYYAHRYFGWVSSRKLEDCDILVTWGLSALPNILKAKKMGIVTILERGSSHILTQKRLLEEENERLGIKMNSSRYLMLRARLDREIQEYEEADYISIPSSFVYRTFVEEGVSKAKLIQIPYGVSLEHFKPIPKEDEVFRVMHIGGSLRKGTHYLLQAMSELNLKNAELMLIGRIEEPVRRFLQRYKGILRVFPGLPHTELYRYYSQNSIYILPSIDEGFAMVQAEAMACGLPVISSSNTGGEDIIRNGVDGFIVPVRDVGTLKEKISYLYEHEEKRKEMGRNALERAKEFTWDRYGERMVEAYKTILSSKEDKQCLVK